MHSWASGSLGCSTLEAHSDAASSTVPAAVTQDWSGWGDRKNARIGKDVWDSSRAANHPSHVCHSSVNRLVIPMR